ncbi:N-6 DNA methylase [Plantibacter sp. CFBP 13570]|uniref:N-6 DNA methylase n=1 Tax=Plantibacter sp. CFBP 13570 TaxID=2775272 RepID=UPI001930C36A|nr:N-6 DNA methylase [Plantibacter sp. CFBP 13570]
MTKPTVISDTKRHGQHYTPTELAEFLASQSMKYLADREGEIVVVDPACGDGELLLAAAAEVGSSGGRFKSIRLIGYDIDEEAISVARERLALAGLQAEIIHEDFLIAQRTMQAQSIDLIITNPPYVRTQHLGQASAQLLAAEFGLSGRVDLTHAFVTTASRLLRPGGVLGLLCSNRVLTTLAGENVRRALVHDGLHVSALYDLGDTKLFRAAVLPAIVIASRNEPTGEPVRFVSAYQLASGSKAESQPLFDALSDPASSTALHGGKHYQVKVGTFTATSDVRTPWRLSETASDKWLDDVKAGTWKTFGDVAKIRVGIKTTADKVFLSDDWDRAAPEVEDELLLPLITQSNVTPWSIAPELEMKVLYPYDLSSEKRRTLDIDVWPGAKQYLLRHEEQLRGRRYVIEGGREWWEIWVPQRPSLWAIPKIVFPDISEQPRFALDTTGSVVNGNCYWISLSDIGDEDIAFLMLAVANSGVGVRFYDEVCGNKLYSGKRRWITQYVNRLPLPVPTTPEAKKVILHARALAASGQFDEASAERLEIEVEAAFVASARAVVAPGAEERAATLF